LIKFDINHSIGCCLCQPRP